MSEAGFRKITEAEWISLALTEQIEGFYNPDTAPSVYELSDSSFFYARGDGSIWRTVS